MSNAPLLPHAAAWKDAQGRPLPVEFFRFLSDLQRYIRDAGGGTADLAELAARVAALEEGQQTSIRGIGSVRVQNGVVQLLGDVDNPSGSQVYGSSAAGERGWWNIVDALTVGAGLTKTASDDGYNLLGELDDVSDLPGSASVDDAYLIDGNYWVWGGSDWTNVGPPSNTAGLALYPGANQDDGLLWNPSLPTPNYEVARIVRNPMTTAGDVIVGGASGAPNRLAAGSNGQVLTMVSGSPAWAAGGGGGGGGWTQVASWDFAVDGAVSEVVGDVTGYSECYAAVHLVTLSGAGWRYLAVSTNGGVSWHPDYIEVSTNGVESATTTGVPPPLHSASSSAARTGFVSIPILPSAGRIMHAMPCRSITGAGIVNLPGPVTHVKLYGNGVNFTGGKAEIWVR